MKNAAGPRRVWVLAIAVAAVIAALAANAGRLLVVDDPEPSDVILVLAGETDHRPARALQLLDQGYGRRVLMDVPAAARIYEFTQIELAEKYIQDLPEAASMRICPIEGLSTRDESHDVEKCLAGEEGRRSSDRDVRLPHPPLTQHFPPRSAREVVLGGGSTRRHAVRNTMVDAPAVGQDVPGRMAAAAVVERSRTMAMSRMAGPQRKAPRNVKMSFPPESYVPSTKGIDGQQRGGYDSGQGHQNSY